MTFDPHKELDYSLRDIQFMVEISAWMATERIRDMHTLPTGVCYCGNDMSNHSAWDNHSPTEMRRDKSWLT